MTVATPVQPDKTNQAGSAYTAHIDQAIAALLQLAGSFAPHEAATPDMTVVVEAGFVRVAGNLWEKSQQASPTITAPGSGSRIDRIVLDETSGNVEVLTGTALSPPSVPAGKIPVAQITVQSDTTAITNSLITDERPLFQLRQQAPVTGSLTFSSLSPGHTASLQTITHGLGTDAVMIQMMVEGSVDHEVMGLARRPDGKSIAVLGYESRADSGASATTTPASGDVYFNAKNTGASMQDVLISYAIWPLSGL